MAYKNFRFKSLREKFGLRQTKGRLFPASIRRIDPSDLLERYLKRTATLPLNSEKAVSEAIVFPIIDEIRERNKDSIECYSGEMLDADPEQGLNGECDFILSRSPGSVEVLPPIFHVTEAPKGDVENTASPAQTAAQLLGAQIFNKQNNASIGALYGACTNGREWIFMKLEGTELTLDSDRYFLNDLPRLLAIHQHIVDQSK